MNSLEKSIIGYLSERPYGALEPTLLNDLSTYTGRNIKVALSRMFGVYIDRWEWSPVKSDYVAVYRLVSVPPHAIKPETPHATLPNGRRVVTNDPHAAYLFDRRIDRSLLAGHQSDH